MTGMNYKRICRLRVPSLWFFDAALIAGACWVAITPGGCEVMR
jgi:hypothetical protein